MTEMIGHVAETVGHDEPKTEPVTMDRNPRSRCRNHRSRWAEIRTWVGTGQPPTHHRPAPLPPRAALEVLGAECNLIAVAGGNIARGIALQDVDFQRVLVATNRVIRLVEAYAA